MKITIKSTMIAAFAALAMPAWAAQAASTGSNAPAAAGTFGQDEILGFIVVLLLIPVIALGALFRNLVLQKFRTKYGNGGKGGAFLSAAILLLAGQSAFAAGNSGPFAIFGDFTPVTWALLSLFLLEMALIIFFAVQISSIVNPKVYRPLGEREAGWWEKINALRPMGEEASYETGHDYDGIRELDNVIPPWFTAAFLLSIIFA